MEERRLLRHKDDVNQGDLFRTPEQKLAEELAQACKRHGEKLACRDEAMRQQELPERDRQ